jgi:adenylate cyclase
MAGTRKIAAIVVADIVGYSRLAGADEDRTLSRLRGLRSDLIDPAIDAHHGRIVKRTGDGSLIEFRSVVDAVQCAIEVQNGMAERNAGLPRERRIEFRVGVHLGDVVEESDGDLMGDGVNIAARLESIAMPGAICLSEDAYRQVKGRFDFAVRDLGLTKLKNITDPMRVYSLEVGKTVASTKGARVHRRQLFPALAALAALVVVTAAAWHFFGSRLSTTAPLPALASSFGPMVTVSPFANTSGDSENDALAMRIGQKATDYLVKFTLLHTIGSWGGAARSAADPVVAGRELGAAYVVTGNVESGTGALRATFQVNEAHSGARIWSQTLAPILEDPKSGASEEELAGRAAALMKEAILVAENARAQSKDDGQRTAYDCVVIGFSVGPNTAAGVRDCLEAAAQREPSNANVWMALANVVKQQRIWGWGLSAGEAVIEKRDHLADRQLEAALHAVDLAPHDAGAQAALAYSYYAKCQPDRLKVEVEKAVAFNPYDADNLGGLGRYLAFSGQWDEGTAFAEQAIKLMGPAAQRSWWWGPAKRHWFRGEYPEAYEAFQHSYTEGLWLSHLDLAYTLPFLGRIDEAKAQIAALLRVYPSMTIREADAFYKLICFEPAFREKMAGALRQAGLPE